MSLDRSKKLESQEEICRNVQNLQSPHISLDASDFLNISSWLMIKRLIKSAGMSLLLASWIINKLYPPTVLLKTKDNLKLKQNHFFFQELGCFSRNSFKAYCHKGTSGTSTHLLFRLPDRWPCTDFSTKDKGDLTEVSTKVVDSCTCALLLVGSGRKPLIRQGTPEGGRKGRSKVWKERNVS